MLLNYWRSPINVCEENQRAHQCHFEAAGAVDFVRENGSRSLEFNTHSINSSHTGCRWFMLISRDMSEYVLMRPSGTHSFSVSKVHMIYSWIRYLHVHFAPHTRAAYSKTDNKQYSLLHSAFFSLSFCASLLFMIP